jgi:hypothetical protein
MHQNMPKASGVAGAPHQLVPGAHDAVPVPSAALLCRATGAVCPALAALFSSLAPAGGDAVAWVQNLAPCSDCRVAFTAARDKLRHLRLGQREREILVEASANGILTLTEAGMSRSLSAARRRAALSLGKAGLVAPAHPPAAADGPPQRRAAVALTPLGRYVLSAYGRPLSAGAPVRWTRPLKGVELPGRDPSALRDAALARCQAALRETLGELMGVLSAAVARPLKDAALLDTLTRHLEQKAAVLRGVLAPPANGAP